MKAKRGIEMVREIVRDAFFLQIKSEPATEADLPTACDLLDTLAAHKDGCVGMAANMIGVNKRIIIVNLGMVNLLMVNPVILSKSGKYETMEGCLSLSGERKAIRYREIEVEYQDQSMKKHTQKFSGWISEIIQHEMDHLEGIII